MPDGEPEDHAHVYSEAVRRGGTLVSVRTEEDLADRVQSILNRHNPIDPVSRGAEYKKRGWNRFDPKAPSYRPSESEIQRIRADYR